MKEFNDCKKDNLTSTPFEMHYFTLFPLHAIINGACNILSHLNLNTLNNLLSTQTCKSKISSKLLLSEDHHDIPMNVAKGTLWM